MKLRTLIFWPHLIAGITAGVVILVMSVTGVLLTYERQLIAWSDSQYRSTAQAGNRLPVETLLQTIRTEHPDITCYGYKDVATFQSGARAFTICWRLHMLNVIKAKAIMIF